LLSIEKKINNFYDFINPLSSVDLQGFARTQFPTNINYDPEVITLGLLAGVSPTVVQWKGLFPGEPPSWSRCPLVQVSMPCCTYFPNLKKAKIWHSRIVLL